MELDGTFVNAEISSDLLIEFALEYMPKNLAFAAGQSLEWLAQRPQPVTLGTIFGIAGQRSVHRCKQVLFRGILGQEILRAAAHGLHGAGNIPMAGQKMGSGLPALWSACCKAIATTGY